MITVVVPVHNEQDNIAPLLQEIVSISNRVSISEVIYVEDGSTDESLAVLTGLQKNVSNLRIIRHPARFGQSAAFLSGVRAAGNGLVVLMDGDGQNDPRDIETLYESYKRHTDRHKKLMIAGQRVGRKDTAFRRLCSKLANTIRSAILKDGIRDTGCSLKLIRREDYLRLPYFNHMHRFLPALLMRDHVHIETVNVSHRPRERGKSKYGFFDRLRAGISDLIGVRWLLSRGLPDSYKPQEML